MKRLPDPRRARSLAGPRSRSFCFSITALLPLTLRELFCFVLFCLESLNLLGAAVGRPLPTLWHGSSVTAAWACDPRQDLSGPSVLPGWVHLAPWRLWPVIVDACPIRRKPKWVALAGVWPQWPPSVWEMMIALIPLAAPASHNRVKGLTLSSGARGGGTPPHGATGVAPSADQITDGDRPSRH